MRIGSTEIGDQQPTYFIADIAANHDGSLDRALELIHLCAEAGADAAKFQNFKAEEIVSERGFAELGGKVSHQSSWDRSVVEVYRDASIPLDWTPVLRDACIDAGIDYFSAAYDFESLLALDPYVPAFKIGSGDLTWLESVERTASLGKPVLLATGASDIGEVAAAVAAIRRHTDDFVLMQCNTNYTGSPDNFNFINLNVLSGFRAMFPGVILGLSDHTPGLATTLGAIALGARVIEKHFTDSTTRSGPDHAFSMTPAIWREMVDRSRELEKALGSPLKRVEPNEAETVVIQRRGVRARRPIGCGDLIQREDLTVLRPCPEGAISADQLLDLVGLTATRDLAADEQLRWSDVR